VFTGPLKIPIGELGSVTFAGLGKFVKSKFGSNACESM